MSNNQKTTAGQPVQSEVAGMLPSSLPILNALHSQLELGLSDFSERFQDCGALGNYYYVITCSSPDLNIEIYRHNGKESGPLILAYQRDSDGIFLRTKAQLTEVQSLVSALASVSGSLNHQETPRIGPPYTSLEDIVYYYTYPKNPEYSDTVIAGHITDVPNVTIHTGDRFPVTVRDFVSIAAELQYDIEHTEEHQFYMSRILEEQGTGG